MFVCQVVCPMLIGARGVERGEMRDATPTFSATHLSPTFSVTFKILSATPNVEVSSLVERLIL